MSSGMQVYNDEELILAELRLISRIMAEQLTLMKEMREENRVVNEAYLQTLKAQKEGEVG